MKVPHLRCDTCIPVSRSKNGQRSGLQTGGSIPCRPNTAATLLVSYTSAPDLPKRTIKFCCSLRPTGWLMKEDDACCYHDTSTIPASLLTTLHESRDDSLMRCVSASPSAAWCYQCTRRSKFVDDTTFYQSSSQLSIVTVLLVYIFKMGSRDPNDTPFGGKFLCVG